MNWPLTANPNVLGAAFIEGAALLKSAYEHDPVLRHLVDLICLYGGLADEISLPIPIQTILISGLVIILTVFPRSKMRAIPSRKEGLA